tara:strand:+ start:11335 stop:11631 length:297 start_codon:yes stop_codon:yes gene_type:complete
MAEAKETKGDRLRNLHAPPAWIITICLLILTNTLSGVWWAAVTTTRVESLSDRVVTVEALVAARSSWAADIVELRTTTNRNGQVLNRIEQYILDGNQN